MTARIAVLLPELTDVNGDAQNAAVLARRAAWAGESVTVHPVRSVADLAGEQPAVVVLGSSAESVLRQVLEALAPLRDRLADWIAAGVPVLAVGTGLESLGERVALPGGDVLGLGLVPGTSLPLPARVADDLVVDAVEGRLTGYENHVRGFEPGPGVQPFGRVLRGSGDGRGQDGVRHGSVIGTRLHGPVLARNPHLADAMLAVALGRAVQPRGDAARAADAAAARIADRLLPRR